MDKRTQALTRLAEVIATSSREAPLSLRMCEACVSILGVAGGSLTLAYADPERATLCATDEAAAQLEDIQEVMGQGPSFDAYRLRSTVTAEVDGVSDQRWPLFIEAAKKVLGEGVIYAIPIKPGPKTMGVATFHQPVRSSLSIDPRTSQFLINAVGVALVSDPDVLDDDYLAKAQSWISRSRVHQATGMVMAQLGLSAEDALALIRAHAYAHNATLALTSEDIVGWRLDFTTADRDPEDESR